MLTHKSRLGIALAWYPLSVIGMLDAYLPVAHADEPPAATAADIIRAMQGKWVIVEFKVGGTTHEQLIGREVTIDGDRVLDQSGKLFQTFKINAEKHPVRIDIFSAKQSGMSQVYGIIEVDDSTQTVAWGGQRPVSFDDSPLYFERLKRKPKTEKH